MAGYTRPMIDLRPCRECSEFLVDLGFAPHCYGCDRALMRAPVDVVQASTQLPQPQPVQVPGAPVGGGKPSLAELVDLRR